MLLDLWPLFQGPVVVRSRGGYDSQAQRLPAPRARGTVYDDMGLLVEQAQALVGIWDGRRIRQRLGVLDDDGMDLVAVEDFRPAARYADDGTLVADRLDLTGVAVFDSGVPKIIKADDELIAQLDL